MREQPLPSGIITVFLLLAAVSFLADVSYEGGRSTLGPLLAVTGATAVVAALTVYGELASYAARLVSGIIASLKPGKTSIKALMVAGYGLNYAVPLMAFAPSWSHVVILFVAERVGKGLRAPVRDVLIAGLGRRGIHGRLFGVYELLDQAGAVAGPLLLAYAIHIAGGLQGAYLVLAAPVTLSLIVLAVALAKYPWERVEPPKRGAALAKGKPVLAGIIAATPFLTLIHWVPASFILQARGYTPESIAALYALAMLADAVVAPALGLLFDRYGKAVAASPAPIGLAATLALLTPGFETLAAVLWGIAMGGLETLPRAYLAQLPPQDRVKAYTAFHVASGGFWGVNALIATLAGKAAPVILTALAFTSTLAIIVARSDET